MGKIVKVDPDRLRWVADKVWAAADQIENMQWPGICPEEMGGSAVSGVASPELVAAQLDDVVAEMRGWATAARRSVEEFSGADRAYGDRLDR